MVRVVKDYDMSMLYHPGKSNVVVDALSRMTMVSMSHVDEADKDLVKDVHRGACLGFQLEVLRMVLLWFVKTRNDLW